VEETNNLLKGFFSSHSISGRALSEAYKKNQQIIKDVEGVSFLYKDICLHQLFEQQAALFPEAIALAQGDFQLSYEELNQKANYLAHHLLDRGIGPEVRVGICLKRSPEMILALLAILKAGGAYVPLDVDLPQSRLLYQIQDSQIALLLTQKQMAETLGDVFDQLLCLDHFWDQLHQVLRASLRALCVRIRVSGIIFDGYCKRFLWLPMTAFCNEPRSVLMRLDLKFSGRY
jgi:non-ribosomal peptide synthetase component F